ncbi:MAG: MFS transporter [Trichodesmium sp. St15_bin1_1]|nr:MFS transporter [Trichodesmium sp. St18_bin1]MDE5112280.1 MFS transporter [Trichodesmium sp. St7_bin2_1]MDE5114237.1 MFS transporter [Trichodesmium sp. St15_bin1_1]MDE5118813.1 MFS transporter [Trichodesmium sp. St19_bin1]
MQLSDSDLTKKPKQENSPNTKISAASLAEKEPERGLLPVLKNGKFLILWGGQIFSQLADKVYLVLMIAIIANQFQAAGQTISGWVSAIMIAFTIPAILFGAGAGIYVDRWPKKSVLVVTNIVRGGLVLILPMILWLSNDFNVGNLPLGFCLMLLLTFFVSTLTQFFAPAEQAVIPLIVEKPHLLSANSLYTTTMMASVIIGFAMGDPLLELADSLVAKIGFGETLGKEFVVGGSYAIAGLLLILLKTGEQKDKTEKEQPHILADLRDGLRYLKNHHGVRNAIIQQIILFSIFAALAVLAVRLAEIIPGMEAEEFGLLLAAAGVGLGIGAGIVGQLGHWLSHFQLSMIGSIGMAVSLVGLSIFNQEFWVAMGLISILGIFGAVVGVPMQTTVQAETPEEMRGKVFGLQNNAVNIALSLPLALVGVAETFLGLSTVLVGLAGAAITAGIFFSFFSTQTLE